MEHDPDREFIKNKATDELIESILPKITNLETSAEAHKQLESIIEAKCQEVKKTDYGIEEMPNVELKLAVTEDKLFLKQS